MSKSGMNDGGFVPYEQYKPPFITEDMNVTMSMLKHHIMPDSSEIAALAEALVEALKDNQKGQTNEPMRQLPPLPELPETVLPKA